MTDDRIDLDEEMTRARLTQEDLQRLTGASRATFFRWKKEPPVFVLTICRQQIRINALLSRLEQIEAAAKELEREQEARAQRLAGSRETHSPT